MNTPRIAFGATPQGGQHLQPVLSLTKGGSAVFLVLQRFGAPAITY